MDSLTVLVRTCTFIYFEEFSSLYVYSLLGAIIYFDPKNTNILLSQFVENKADFSLFVYSSLHIYLNLALISCLQYAAIEAALEANDTDSYKQ